MMEEALISLMLADDAISGLVGNRIFWSLRKQGSPLPAIVLNRISSVQGYNMNGQDNLSRARIQVDCYATTFGQSRALSRAVFSLLSGRRGVQGTVEFQGIFLDSERDNPVEDDPLVFRNSLDFIVWSNSTG